MQDDIDASDAEEKIQIAIFFEKHSLEKERSRG